MRVEQSKHEICARMGVGGNLLQLLPRAMALWGRVVSSLDRRKLPVALHQVRCTAGRIDSGRRVM